jgi:hypothetical protein
MTAIYDADGRELPADKDLGEGAENLRDQPDESDANANNADPKTERKLDKALKESFDCSDPVSINPGAD